MKEVALETARLRLRARDISDLEANLAMDLDPQVHRYIFIHGPPDPATHRAELARRIRMGWPGRGGLWVVEWQNEPGFLGWCGLLPLERTGLIEIGYRYVPSAWGRGVATDVARAVLDHGFRELGFDPVVAVTHPGNLASRRVLEKIGLRDQGLSHHYAADLAFYRLTRGEYLASRAGSPTT
ncbi:MAG: GNAT family N-acetyltransferase [Candidatus Limnocylindria bacterium]